MGNSNTHYCCGCCRCWCSCLLCGRVIEEEEEEEEAIPCSQKCQWETLMVVEEKEEKC